MNLDAIKKQADAVGQLRQALRDTDALLSRVAGKDGQNTCAHVAVNGVDFELLKLSTAYMPELIKGMETMQREALRLLTLRRDSIRSRLEGAEWKLRQLTKAQA